MDPLLQAPAAFYGWPGQGQGYLPPAAAGREAQGQGSGMGAQPSASTEIMGSFRSIFRLPTLPPSAWSPLPVLFGQDCDCGWGINDIAENEWPGWQRGSGR